MGLTVVVSGMVAGTPGHGGATWAILQYLLGLARLGHEAALVEPVDGDAEGSVSATWCAEVAERFGLDGRWCLVGAGGGTAGMTRPELRAVAERADLLLNVSGMLADVDVLDRIPVRAYLDLDPAFVQLWHAVEGIDMRLDAHTHFVTLSDRVGATIPDCGRAWIDTLPPVVLAEWPVATVVRHDALTTVASWRGYGSIHHGGHHYGQKAHSFRPLLPLPTRVEIPVTPAVGIHPDEVDDLAALRAHGWHLLDPAEVARTPDDYRSFVAGSRAELGVAKSGYVVSDSGWFSDRSACYLASGRPVIAQDTGFGRRLPTGAGLLAFGDLDGAVAAVREVEADYEHHRLAARAVAEEHLDSDVVLGRLLDRLPL